VNDPRPRKRYKATREEWAALHKAFTAERCWVCGGPWDDLHHILSRAHGGDDVVANLASLCRQCHYLVTIRDARARALLRGALMPSNLAYLERRLDEDVRNWLDRVYPSAVAA
jgi:5-methylcytosine-specific restriction endonuclease McrA